MIYNIKAVLRILSQGEVDLRYIHRHQLYQFHQKPDVPDQVPNGKRVDKMRMWGIIPPLAMILSLMGWGGEVPTTCYMLS